MFFVTWFVLSWTVWGIFADKKRWREIFPVTILAGFLGSTTDTLTLFYPLWTYEQYEKKLLIAYLIDDWGIYITVVYLFIQWLPRNKTFTKMFKYLFYWTGTAISIESIYLFTDHLEHHKWWNFGYSYLADWFLFSLFYLFYKAFKLEKLSESDLEK